MIAVRIGPQLRMAVIAAPSYFAAHGKPKTPHDLTSHNCINLRMRSSGALYVWEFEKGGKEVNVRVDGQLTLNSAPLIMEAVRDGHGIAYIMEDRAEPFSRQAWYPGAGGLVPVVRRLSPLLSEQATTNSGV